MTTSARGLATEPNVTPMFDVMLVLRIHATFDARPDKTLIVRGDDDATYQEVMTAVDVRRVSR